MIVPMSLVNKTIFHCGYNCARIHIAPVLTNPRKGTKLYMVLCFVCDRLSAVLVIGGYYYFYYSTFIFSRRASCYYVLTHYSVPLLGETDWSSVWHTPREWVLMGRVWVCACKFTNTKEAIDDFFSSSAAKLSTHHHNVHLFIRTRCVVFNTY